VGKKRFPERYPKSETMKKYLVLSGGGCRGFAHIGVVKALQEANVELGGISATSAGAIAGAFLANGYEPEEIREIFSGTKLNLFA
jgi:NTE family protein